MTIILNNNVITTDIVNTIIEDRLSLLKEVIIENTHLKLFDNDTFELITSILACFKDFVGICNSLNILVNNMANITDKNKLKAYINSSYVYLDRMNSYISTMIYLTKKLNMTIKPKYIKGKANILFDYDLTFSYDNLKDVRGVNVIEYSVLSNVSLMKIIYKAYDDKLS